ncbi:hypothetical protein NPIL_653151 [Nephila pilipes]|uniref:Uncharacterized protein n=1 Tax=Nephila pilipes TaxID=299642 RepID=A0A8X6NB29_NEPPI|nr:hypothetical protein NPIL_653151 [Nephila pilipes]
MKEAKEWIPVTKVGKLVKNGRIKFLGEIRKYSHIIRERETIDLFFKNTFESDRVTMTATVQEWTKANQRSTFKDNKSQNWRAKGTKYDIVICGSN